MGALFLETNISSPPCLNFRLIPPGASMCLINCKNITFIENLHSRELRKPRFVHEETGVESWPILVFISAFINQRFLRMHSTRNIYVEQGDGYAYQFPGHTAIPKKPERQADQRRLQDEKGCQHCCMVRTRWELFVNGGRFCELIDSWPVLKPGYSSIRPVGCMLRT